MAKKQKKFPDLEVVQVSEGEFALHYSDLKGEPILSIRFSKESQEFLGKNCVEIVEEMVHAGIQAYSKYYQKKAETQLVNLVNSSDQSSDLQSANTENSAEDLTPEEEEEFALLLEEEMPTIH